MSTWYPESAYDVGRINNEAVVLVRGGKYYHLYGDDQPPWRIYATAHDMDAARSITKAMSATLRVKVES